MPAARFVAADLVGAGLWSATFTCLGYVFADRVGDLLGVLHQAQLTLGLALAAAVGGVLVVRRRRARRGP